MWHRFPSLAYLAVFLGVLGHATTEFTSKLTGVGGPETSVWRFVLGGAGLVILALTLPGTRDLLAPVRRRPGRVLGLSFLGVTAAYLAFHWSLDFATVPQVATMITTMPIFVALVNLRLNRHPIGAAKWMSGVAAVLGVTLLLTDGYLAALAGSARNLVGLGLTMTCAALAGTYTVMARPLILEFGAVRIIALTMFLGGLGLWLAVGASFGAWVDPTDLFRRPAGEAAAILTLALYNTTLTQILWIGGLAAVPDITRGSYLFFLKPVIAASLAAVFLGTEVTAPQAGAILVICGAVALEAGWGRVRRLLGLARG